MSLTLYDASVPVLSRYLKNLAKLLALAQRELPAQGEHPIYAMLFDLQALDVVRIIEARD